MSELKRLGVLSVGKVFSIIYAVFGLIGGILIALVGPLAAAGATTPGLAGLGFLAIIVLPIIYAIGGFIGGVIVAALYNLVAGKIGGIEFETK